MSKNSDPCSKVFFTGETGQDFLDIWWVNYFVQDILAIQWWVGFLMDEASFDIQYLRLYNGSRPLRLSVIMHNIYLISLGDGYPD